MMTHSYVVISKFGNNVPPPSTSDSIRVALLLPLSGPNSELGRSMLNAAQLALFDFADLRFELLIYDTKGVPAGAEFAAQAAISDGAALIIGPLLAKSVESAAFGARQERRSPTRRRGERGAAPESDR